MQQTHTVFGNLVYCGFKPFILCSSQVWSTQVTGWQAYAKCGNCYVLEKGGDTIHDAAQKYGIPHFTLHDHVSGKIEHDSDQERLDMPRIKKG